jgi:hypothetical protein
MRDCIEYGAVDAGSLGAFELASVPVGSWLESVLIYPFDVEKWDGTTVHVNVRNCGDCIARWSNTWGDVPVKWFNETSERAPLTCEVWADEAVNFRLGVLIRPDPVWRELHTREGSMVEARARRKLQKASRLCQRESDRWEAWADYIEEECMITDINGKPLFMEAGVMETRYVWRNRPDKPERR